MLCLPVFKGDNSIIRRRPLISLVLAFPSYPVQKIPLPFGVRQEPVVGGLLPPVIFDGTAVGHEGYECWGEHGEHD
jgi:hypothetical protein